MEETYTYVAVGRAIIFFLFIVLIIYFNVENSESPFVKRNIKRYLFLRSLEDQYKPYLSKYFTFYNSLNANDKQMFERRVQKFIDMKQFIPRGVNEVTAEMKALIAGSAIQITFGYPDIYFTYFWRILIYSDSYYSQITRRYHQGEVNAQGIIILSWKSFKDGFINPVDGHNLGFHEMAHALRLINIVDNEEYDFYDRDIMYDFESEAHREILRINQHPGEPTIFRGYFIPNIEEFFAVSVECFFERSLEFRDYNRRLYNSLARILKVDPLVLSERDQVLAS